MLMGQVMGGGGDDGRFFGKQLQNPFGPAWGARAQPPQFQNTMPAGIASADVGALAKSPLQQQPSPAMPMPTEGAPQNPQMPPGTAQPAPMSEATPALSATPAAPAASEGFFGGQLGTLGQLFGKIPGLQQALGQATGGAPVDYNAMISKMRGYTGG